MPVLLLALAALPKKRGQNIGEGQLGEDLLAISHSALARSRGRHRSSGHSGRLPTELSELGGPVGPSCTDRGSERPTTTHGCGMQSARGCNF